MSPMYIHQLNIEVRDFQSSEHKISHLECDIMYFDREVPSFQGNHISIFGVGDSLIYLEHQGNSIHQNAGTCWLQCMMSYPRRL